jgi:hypothetical protein
LIKKITPLALLIFILFLAACETSSLSNIPDPEPGMTTIAGRVVSNLTGEPVADTIVRFAEVYSNDQGEKAYALDEAFSPGTMTDENGYFVVSNIAAREYVIVIGDPRTKYAFVTESSGQVKLWSAEADKVLQTGTINVDY